MNKCSKCASDFNDGVQCSVCKRHYDFPCSGITESGFRKLGADKRTTWKCTTRKNPVSPSINKDNPVSLEAMLTEILDLKRQLAVVPKLTNDINCIRNDIKKLTSSCEFNNAQLIERANKISAVEQKVTQFDVIEKNLVNTTASLDKIQLDLEAKAQWARLNNAQIKGVPLKTGENLFSVVDSICNNVGYMVPKTQINYLARVPTFNDKDKSIVVSFINRYIKEEFIASARAKKTLTAYDLGYKDSPQRVFVNDHLTPESMKLLSKTKTALRDKGYQYIVAEIANSAMCILATFQEREKSDL